jgi:succinate dehydrogenase hydrophobic anchor subunit
LSIRRWGAGAALSTDAGPDGDCLMTVVSVSKSPRSVERNEQWTLRDACFSLVIALAVTLVTFAVLGLALHQLDSRYTFSLDRAVHQTWAWLSILVLSVLWLISGLVHQTRGGRGPADREPATSAGETNNKDSVVFVQKQLQGRVSSRRPRANREVAG